MKRVPLLMHLVCLLHLFATATWAQSTTSVLIQYPKPHQTTYEGEKFLIKAYLDGDGATSFSNLELANGYQASVTEKNDTAWVWVPVIGKVEMMKLISANRKAPVHEQLFTPLVAANWDFFKEGTFHIISSSHQDIAWMNTPDSCKEDRVDNIILPALDIMKTDPDYHFGMEQVLNLKEFMEEHPERKKEVIQRCKEGRFAWGATYNQPYEGLQTGEQLIRQVYLGRRWLKDNFPGCDDRTAYNIDVPGRTLQMPQILSKSGVDYLFISRQKEGFYDWYSPDGTSILTYTPGNYGWAIIFYKFFEEDAIEAMKKLQSRVEMWSDYYREHNLPPHFAIVISTDAAGPSNYASVVSEWNTIVKKTGAKIPTLRHSTAQGFLDEITKNNLKLERIDGERPNLWAYIHGPGHQKAIASMRHAGRALPAAEIFSSVSGLVNNTLENYPQSEITQAYENSIYPDHGWGGKNGHITDSIFKSKLDQAAQTADEIVGQALQSISDQVKTEKSGAIVVFNDLSWKRSDIASVKLEKTGDYYVTNERGQVVASQTGMEGGEPCLWFYAKDIPSLGYKTWYLKKGKKSLDISREVVPNACSNEFYDIGLGDGGISYLYDKQLKKEVIRSTRFSGGDVLTMGYFGNGAGEFTQFTTPTMDGYDKTSSHDSRWTILSDGNIFTEYENRMPFKNAEIVQRVKVYHPSKKIDLSVDLLNWDGTRNREFRFAVPLNMDDFTISYEAPMAISQVGKSEMKQRPKGWSWGGTYYQKPEEIHPREVMNYISSSNDQWAVTLSSDVAVADWVDPTREAVDYPVLQGILLASHKSCHGLGNWYLQKGDHHFRFSIKSHPAGTQEAYHFGTSANHPLRAVSLSERNSSGSLPSSRSFVSVSDPMVRISTLKKSEDDNALILRLVEMEGKDKQVELTFHQPFKQVFKTNLVEENPESLGQSGTTLKVPMGKNAIEAYKIVF